VRETWQAGGTPEAPTVERIRRADNDHERAQLRHEATMLTLARHPAVAAIVSAHELGDELITQVPAACPLGGPGPPPEVRQTGSAPPPGSPAPGSTGWLAALAATAQTVADLHALGLVHHDLRPDVIWVDAQGRTVLDGFSQAGLAGQPAPGGRGALRPSDDVAALAELATLGSIRAAGPPTGRPGWLPIGRRDRRARRAHQSPPTPSLDELLTAGHGGAWPPARRLAQALEAAVGDAGVGSAARIVARPAAEATRRSRPPLATAGLAVVGLVALAWGAMTVAARPARPSLDRSPAPQVVVGTTRYRVGRPGDEVRIGRWSCQPSRAVLLRPATGQVYLFTGWATVGHDEVAHPVDRVPAGSSLVVTRSTQGCDLASVTTPAGATIHIRLGTDG
jgi:hypothetical protein